MGLVYLCCAALHIQDPPRTELYGGQCADEPVQYSNPGFAVSAPLGATLRPMPFPGNIADFYPQWIVHGSWPCGHNARIDLGRFMAWGMIRHSGPLAIKFGSSRRAAGSS
jgi:hypothetical protein